MAPAEIIARAFHAAYERLAPAHGYQTRQASAVPWEDVPVGNKSLMIATVADLLGRRIIAPGEQVPAPAREPLLGDIVWYRGRQGVHAVRAAVVTATVSSLDPLGVAAGTVTALTDGTRVHLWVFTPSDAGGFAEYDVPAAPEGTELSPGEWRRRPAP
ncbi:hypothetical protein ACQEU6_08825 [Spirillospora sp. CA-108201]